MSAGLHSRCNREINGVLHKRCTRCNHWKPRVASFRPKPKKGRVTLSVVSWCRECEAANSRDWHAENYMPTKREARPTAVGSVSGLTLAEVWRQ